MTTFPALSAADQIAAMEARAETERTIYGQTTVPAMLLQGAAWGEELHLMKTAGIIEVAVRNPSVFEYMQHWEARAETAEAEVARLRTAAGAAAKELRTIAGMDMIGASAVAYNAARDLERALAQGEAK